jgi:hypothetical protein
MSGFGRPSPGAKPVESVELKKPPPNGNLTAALRASLKAIDSPITEPEPEGFNGAGSPLSEVTPDAIDILLNRFNEHLIDGAPERITDEALTRMVDIYRSQALRWEQEEQQEKKPRQRKDKASQAMDLGDDFQL